MRIYTEFSIADFEAWDGGEDTQNMIIRNSKEEEFENLADEYFPDGCSEEEMNDFLRFEDDFIFERLGINPEEDAEEDPEEDAEDAENYEDIRDYDDWEAYCDDKECDHCPCYKRPGTCEDVFQMLKRNLEERENG